MPPKRKAAGSKIPDASPAKIAKSAANTNHESNAQAKTPSNGRGYKFSNPNTLSQKPSYVLFDWCSIDNASDNDEDEDGDAAEECDCESCKDGKINGWDHCRRKAKHGKGESEKEEDLDLPAPGEILTEKWCTRVSDVGFPISEDGMQLAQKLDGEQEKRTPGPSVTYSFNDFTGYGFCETIETFLKDFDGIIHKKTISPYKKWAYIEALAVFFVAGDTDMWMMVDDADGIREVCEMVATMLLTSLEVLSEHNLFTTDSEIKNIPIVCLIFLEFFDNTAGDLSLACQCEILRLCDEVGIDLAKHVRKQLHIPETKFNEWRDQYKSKKEDFPDANDGNGYKFWAEKDDWKPADEMKLNPRWNQMERQWFRWDWKLEYKEFKKNHPGGNYYVIGSENGELSGTDSFDEELDESDSDISSDSK